MGPCHTLRGVHCLVRASVRRLRWCVRTTDHALARGDWFLGKVLEAVAGKLNP
ncbi:MAG TPA: hypothetical protein VEU33_05910 [Archangium sp.]|nr:hypothetical protein [Archangium sp.]